jgi:hypothetical protein
MFRKIGHAVKPKQPGGIAKVLIPHHHEQDSDLTPRQVLESGCDPAALSWEHVTDAGAIERHLLDYNNRENFRKAAASPCGHGVIHDALTYSGLSAASDSILQGEIPPEWNVEDGLLRSFLASFAIPPENLKDKRDIESTITDEDFKYGITGWQKSTSTSPSGRHLGHYKSIVQDADLLGVQVMLMNIAIKNGIALDRWCKSVTVMIEKDTGRPAIRRLRIIHLYKADYNLFLKLQWGSRLVRHGEKHHGLNDQQFGSRKGRTAMDPVLLKQLSFVI